MFAIRFHLLVLVWSGTTMTSQATRLTLEDKDAYFETIVQTQNELCSTAASCRKSPPRARGSNRTVERPLGSMCCGFCSCHQSCYNYGSCCMGKYNDFVEFKYYETLSQRYECVHPHYLVGNRTKYGLKFRYWMITQCPYETTNATLKELCQTSADNFETITTVTDLQTHTHYRNKFCAFCNGLDENTTLTKWKPEIFCDRVLFASENNLLETVQEKRCNIVFRQPSETVTRQCTPLPSYEISTCNETGLWPTYDEGIDFACNFYVDPFNVTYKNYFCYVCNTDAPLPYEQWICPDIGSETFIEDLPLFTAVIDVDAVTPVKRDDKLFCDRRIQFEDYKMMVCRDLHCYQSRHLSSEGVCEPVSSFESDVPCHAIFLKLTPAQGYILFKHELTARYVIEDIRKTISLNLKNWGFTVTETRIYQKESLVYENLVEYVVAYFAFDIDTINNTFHKIVNKFTSYLNDSFITATSSCLECRIVFDMVIYPHYSTDDNSRYTVNIPNVYTMPPYGINKVCSVVNKLVECTSIEIGFNELHMRIENDILYIEETFVNNITLTRWAYVYQDSKIRICLEDYRPIYDAMPMKIFSQKFQGHSDVHPMQWLSFISICVSMTCLLVTIFIHLMFAQLQSQPGINNTILCIFLFLAQGVFQFAAGQTSVPQWACTIIGAACHFLWLAVMFSMNVCSVHMLAILKKTVRISRRFCWKTSVRNLLYIVCLSALLVSINLIASLASTSGQDSGYGGRICYISSYVMHLTTFILPSAVVITINIVIFSSFVFKLFNVNKGSILKHERSYFSIYARLSTLTGITWLFGFLQILIKSEISEYLFIIFNASQGVYTMIAFIMNSKVYALLLKSCKSIKDSETKSDK